MSIITIVVFSCLIAVMARMGGSGNYPRQIRVIGVPVMLGLLAYILGFKDLPMLTLSTGLTIASISTYWDFLFKDDNFFFHGFMLGLSAAPIAYVTGEWPMFILRTIIVTIYVGVWSLIWKWDIAEEVGRYVILPATLLMLIHH